jgi:hypothetical protein
MHVHACISSHPLSSFSNVLSLDNLHSFRTRIGAPQANGAHLLTKTITNCPTTSINPGRTALLAFACRAIPTNVSVIESGVLETTPDRPEAVLAPTPPPTSRANLPNWTNSRLHVWRLELEVEVRPQRDLRFG